MPMGPWFTGEVKIPTELPRLKTFRKGMRLGESSAKLGIIIPLISGT